VTGADRVTAYGPFYAAVACIAFVLSFLPPYDVRRIDGLVTTYGNVWQDLPEGATVPAALLIFALLAFALAVNLQPPATPGSPAVIVVLGAVGLILVALKPGTGTPEPDLAVGGLGLLGVTILTVGIGLIHAAHLAVVRSRQSA
jgi:hypothetical protein